MNVEIEFKEWVHPRLGVTKVEVEGGKPLVLKAKIKQEWVGLNGADWNDFNPLIANIPHRVAEWVEKKLKERNT